MHSDCNDSDCNEGQVDTKHLHKQAASIVKVLHQTHINPSLINLGDLKQKTLTGSRQPGLENRKPRLASLGRMSTNCCHLPPPSSPFRDIPTHVAVQPQLAALHDQGVQHHDEGGQVVWPSQKQHHFLGLHVCQLWIFPGMGKAHLWLGLAITVLCEEHQLIICRKKTINGIT